MYTTTDLAHAMKRPVRTIRAAIKRLGYQKIGRDYILTAAQWGDVIAEMHDGPGHPRSTR